jgi:hypothetical protein
MRLRCEPNKFQPKGQDNSDGCRPPQPKLAIIGDNGAGKPNYYGLGWFISEHRGHKIIFHPGDKPGFSSTFTRFVDERLTVILLCNNSTDSPAFAMSLGIADLYLRNSSPSAK